MSVDLSGDLSKEIINGHVSRVEDVVQATDRFIAAFQTLSLFGENKAVWLRDVNFLADSKVGSAEGTLAELKRLKTSLETINPDSVNVLVTACPVDRRRSFYKWAEKNSDFQFIKKGNSHDLARYIRKELQAHDLQISGDALELLNLKVNGNARMAITEVQKLATYATGNGAGEIQVEDVKTMVPDSTDGDFFETTEIFFTGDLQGTLKALKNYFFTNKEARPLLASLQSRNRLLIQLRTLMDEGELRISPRGVDKASLAKAGEKYHKSFGGVKAKSPLNVFTQNPWYLGKLSEQARQWKLRKMLDFQLAFVDAFRKLVSRSREQHEVMRSLAIQCLAQG